MKNIPSEAQEQKALVKWLSYHPVLRNYFCKNNNEGKRSVVSGYNLKLLGLRSGVSDIFVYYPTKMYHGLWLEVKRNKKYTNSEMMTSTWVNQAKFIREVLEVGYAGFFCYGWEDGCRIVENYLLS